MLGGSGAERAEKVVSGRGFVRHCRLGQPGATEDERPIAAHRIADHRGLGRVDHSFQGRIRRGEAIEHEALVSGPVIEGRANRLLVVVGAAFMVDGGDDIAVACQRQGVGRHEPAVAGPAVREDHEGEGALGGRKALAGGAMKRGAGDPVADQRLIAAALRAAMGGGIPEGHRQAPLGVAGGDFWIGKVGLIGPRENHRLDPDRIRAGAGENGGVGADLVDAVHDATSPCETRTVNASSEL